MTNKTQEDRIDYKYTVTKCPFKKVERFIPALNRTIVSYEKLSTVVQNKS